MARDQFNRERAARILAEAACIGDKKAAERNGVSDRSIRNYRLRMETDAELSALFQTKKKLIETEWRQEAITFLRTSIAKLGDMVQAADNTQIREVAGAIKLVGELALMKDVLGGKQPGADREGPAPGTPPGADGAADTRPGIH